ncbi:hypothetical protein [Streptosporangium sp. NPDC002721]|uniref:hypothetical protein n=1 Tax=Streptosporangium sp. NPDC002721 TaxID=3366188 RepID=UPI00368FAD25
MRLHLTPGLSDAEAGFLAGYVSAINTASDLVELAGADVGQWMEASRDVLTEAELAELAQTATAILARRNRPAVAA